MVERGEWLTWRTTAEVTSEKLRSGYGISQQYISHKQMPKLYTSHFLLYGLPLRTCHPSIWQVIKHPVNNSFIVCFLSHINISKTAPVMSSETGFGNAKVSFSCNERIVLKLHVHTHVITDSLRFKKRSW